MKAAAALVSLVCLAAAIPSGAQTEGPRRVSFDAVVLQVKVPELAWSQLPPSFARALQAEGGFWQRSMNTVMERSARVVTIPGTVSPQTVPVEIAVTDAALGAVGDGSGLAMLRRVTRSTKEGDTFFVNVAVAGRSPGGPNRDATRTKPNFAAYAITPRILADGVLELSLDAPPPEEPAAKKDRTFRLRVEPGQAVLIAVAGSHSPDLFPSRKEESLVETRVLVVLRPRLVSPDALGERGARTLAPEPLARP